MKACIRCGNWHTDAEKDVKRRLSCTEVKAYWARRKKKHLEKYGHYPHPNASDFGNWICMKCNHPL